jgi:hypothetical protein
VAQEAERIRFWYHRGMIEQPRIPEEKAPDVGYPDAIEMSSPEFQKLKEEARESLRSRNPKIIPDEDTLNFEAHIRFITRGLAADQEKKREERRQQA